METRDRVLIFSGGLLLLLLSFLLPNIVVFFDNLVPFPFWARCVSLFASVGFLFFSLFDTKFASRRTLSFGFIAWILLVFFLTIHSPDISPTINIDIPFSIAEPNKPPSATFQSAEEVVEEYFNLIVQNKYDEAYALLSKSLQNTVEFNRAEWERYNNNNYFTLLSKPSVEKRGNTFQVKVLIGVHQLFSPRLNNVWVFCVYRSLPLIRWEIQDIHFGQKSCW